MSSGCYAVNLGDLSEVNNRIVGTYLVGPVMGNSVDVDPKKVDGIAVILDCDDERAQAIVDVIRIKRKRHELRCYVRKTPTAKTWKKI